MNAPRNADRQRWIVFPIHAGVSALDLIGPLTVLRDLRFRTPYRAAVLAPDGGLVATDSDLALVATASIDDHPAPWGVIVPGGGPGEAALDAMRDQTLVAYLGQASRTAALIGSIGTGSLVLAAAGLVRDRRVARPPAHGEVLAAHGAVVTADRWVRDDPLLTAAGGTAGIDALLDLVARIVGPGRATMAQLAMEYDPQPPFGPIESMRRSMIQPSGGTRDVR